MAPSKLIGICHLITNISTCSKYAGFINLSGSRRPGTGTKIPGHFPGAGQASLVILYITSIQYHKFKDIPESPYPFLSYAADILNPQSKVLISPVGREMHDNAEKDIYRIV
ncbi:hypothetical protein TWF970_011602 [Orbilia oligospora]|uniref:Uncharacterized protein n=1 Tax=Orbilia oligospora TaxID=2813651 RepID=A0A7C8R3H6_ORBOL|nr:hypothetical protein TWF970_011602 [Orbilia oligospora]